MKHTKSAVTFVGGTLDCKTQQKPDVVNVIHCMIDGTDRQEIYRRSKEDLTKFIYEGNFDRDANQLRFP